MAKVTVDGIWGEGEAAKPLCAEGQSGALAISATRVGIGTTEPQEKLHVQGNVKVQDGQVEVHSGWPLDWIFLRQRRDMEGGGFHIHNPLGDSNQPQGDPARNRLEIAYKKADGEDLWGQFVLHGPSGRVGIGTSSPGETAIDEMHPLLDVAGYASIMGLRIGLDGVNDILSEAQPGLTITAKGDDDPENKVWYGGIKFRTGKGKHVRMRITPDGRVGIGNEKPAQDVRLTVSGHQLVQGPEGYGTIEDPWDEAIVYLGDKNHSIKAVRNVGIRMTTWGARDAITLQQGTGNVGIGKTEPETKLDVNGEIQAHDILLKNADCAEEFAVEDANSVEPGSVMVMNGKDALEPCGKAYDKRVIGIVSGAGSYSPGIVLDRQPGNGDRLPIALMGKVFCKVDAESASIEVGDLLTTSATPGHAMKASDPLQAFGTIIGKALGGLDSGTGLVPVLVTLQ